MRKKATIDVVPGRHHDRDELVAESGAQNFPPNRHLIDDDADLSAEPQLPSTLVPSSGMIAMRIPVLQDLRGGPVRQGVGEALMEGLGNHGNGHGYAVADADLEKPIERGACRRRIVVAPPECRAGPGVAPVSELLVER